MMQFSVCGQPNRQICLRHSHRHQFTSLLNQHQGSTKLDFFIQHTLKKQELNEMRTAIRIFKRSSKPFTTPGFNSRFTPTYTAPLFIRNMSKVTLKDHNVPLSLPEGLTYDQVSSFKPFNVKNTLRETNCQMLIITRTGSTHSPTH